MNTIISDYYLDNAVVEQISSITCLGHKVVRHHSSACSFRSFLDITAFLTSKSPDPLNIAPFPAFPFQYLCSGMAKI